MYRLMCLVTLTISLAADVTVYENHDYYRKNEPTPVEKSLLPCKFGWHRHSLYGLFLTITTKNKSPSVTAVKVSYVIDDGTETEMKSDLLDDGKRAGETFYYLRLYKNISREVNIFVRLYKWKILCASLFVAEGRPYSNETSRKTHSDYEDACLVSCLLEVDLIDQCVDPSLVAERTTTMATLKPVTDADSSNADEKAESNSVAMVASLSCVAVILVVIIIGLWKRPCIKCNQSGTPQLSINEPSDPFYLNMLFRRECDREIEETEQHEYAEIGERVYDVIQNHYEYIHPEELDADRVTFTSSSGTFPVSEDRPSPLNIPHYLRAEQVSGTRDSSLPTTIQQPVRINENI